MRHALAFLLVWLIAAPGYSAGVSYTGVSRQVDTTPDYILIVGDPQIGGYCTNYGWAALAGDDDHKACGQAQLDETEAVILDAFSRYSIGYAVLAGDLVDAGNQKWQRDNLATMLSNLPASIKSKINVVSGNHDSNTSTCNSLDNHLFQDYGTDGGIAEMFWSKKLGRTRIFGFSDSIAGGYYAAPCHAQNDDDKSVTAGNYPQAACFGDDSAGGGGTKENGEVCLVGGDCLSGQCGIWEDYYDDTMNFVAEQFAKFNSAQREEVLIVVGHQALCRDVTILPSCANTYPTDGSRKLQNLYTCESGADEGKYCNQENGSAACAGDAALCTEVRDGFETRTDFIAHIENVDPAKQGIAWASGHVGESKLEPAVATDQFTNRAGTAVPYLKAESVGAHAVKITDLQHTALVIKVSHNAAPEIVEYLNGPNSAPVLGEIGTAGVVSIDATGSGTSTLTATDPDYGTITYYIDPPYDACLSVSNTPTSPDGTLTASSCASGTYGPYTLCATDYINGSNDGTTSPGLEDCDSFTVTVP